MPDGTLIGISNSDSSKGQLVIDPVTEREALDWVRDLTDAKVKVPRVFHIYYLDDNGNLINANGISVTMKPEAPLKNPVVYSLNTDSHMPLIISLLFVSGGAVMGAKALSKKREHSLK